MLYRVWVGGIRGVWEAKMDGGRVQSIGTLSKLLSFFHMKCLTVRVHGAGKDINMSEQRTVLKLILDKK